jgi:aspartate kinase
MERIKIGGILQSEGRALLRVMAAPAQSGAAGTLIGALGERGVNIELLAESLGMEDTLNFTLVFDQKDLDQALSLVEGLKGQLRAEGLSHQHDVAVISVFGPHLREKPLVPGLMFSSLADAGVEPLAIATSISSVSCVVEGPMLEAAVTALEKVFEAPFQVKKRPKDY